MSLRLELGPNAVLSLDEATGQRVLEQLIAQGLRLGGTTMPTTSPASVIALPDDHPMWREHSGGPGHSEFPEWGEDDQPQAEAFYAGVSGKAKVLLDLLIDRPGRLIGATEFQELAPQAFHNDYSVAGSLNGLRKLKEASGRRYPFYWWKGVPTRYAMKVSVAKLFAAARARGI